MPSPQPAALGVAEVLTQRRIGAALGALIDPSRRAADNALGPNQSERKVIQEAMSEPEHPMAGFARRLLASWADLVVDDRVAAVVSFAEIPPPTLTNSPNLDHPPGPGTSR